MHTEPNLKRSAHNNGSVIDFVGLCQEKFFKRRGSYLNNLNSTCVISATAVTDKIQGLRYFRRISSACLISEED